MAVLDFPISPSLNQIYNANGRRWQWNGISWIRIADPGTQGIQGVQGVQGTQGIQGVQGTQGIQGIQGVQGVQGTEGTQGVQGTEGNFGGAAFDYTFDSSTVDADPGQGKLRLNQTTVTAASYLYIHHDDDNFVDVSSYLDTIDDSTSNIKGHFTIAEKGNTSYFGLFSIVGLHTSYTDYFAVPISYTSGITTSFNNNLDTIITFARTGDKGDTGSQGTQGIQGTQGSQGIQGAQGFNGTIGLDGAQGAEGAQGIQGVQGVQGTQGIQGVQGSNFNRTEYNYTATSGQTTFSATYADGTDIDVFYNGVRLTPAEYTATSGTNVVLGTGADAGAILDITTFESAGPQGTNGAQGTQGTIGAQGTDGTQGIQGIQGIQGTQGIQGIQGTQGVQGAQGVQGTQGITGAQGTDGAQGTTGTQGIQGSTSYDAGTVDGLDSTQFLRSDAFDEKTTGSLRFNDNIKATFGNSDDFQIFHDSSGINYIDAASGAFYIRQLVDNSDIHLQTDNGSGGVTTYVMCDGSSGATILYHYGTEKFTTTSSGIEVTGSVLCDGLTVDGSLTQSSGQGLLSVKDSNNTGTSTQAYVRGLDSADTEKWQVGQSSSSNDDLYVLNNSNGKVVLGTNGYGRVEITSAGHVVPNADNTYDLGSSSLRWANIYSADLQLSNEGSTNGVDGTWGKYTIQEGENDLFLINRRTGKKYKFMLEEVK